MVARAEVSGDMTGSIERMTFDPSAPLPGAPDPWASSDMPALRDGPPWAMTEMIAAEPALAGRLVRRLQADPALGQVSAAIREAVAAGLPVTTTGCGTSQHGALAVAALVADAGGGAADRVRAVQAFELAGRRPSGGPVIGISHEGGTDATNEALRRSGGRDGNTALITVGDRSPGAALARHVLATGEQDQSWCHTVGYLSPLVAGACLHAALRNAEVDAEAVERQVAAGSDATVAESLAAGLDGVDRLLVVGSGIDYPAARELALKIEEGVHLPAVAHELETVRHGHLAAADDRTGLVVVLTDGDGRGAALRDRSASVLRSAAALGMPSVVIGSTSVADVAQGASVGSHLVELDPALPLAVAANLGVVVPLQLLTERLARARGTNPDTIGREDPRQAAAASA
jgi:fructoselysine-6-P-deglycase FrlB-like protein